MLMVHAPLTAELTVAEVLTRWPETIPVFLRHQLACIGCVMAPFDTLSDVARIYNLPLDRFLEELRQSIQARGARREGGKGMKITEAFLGEHGVFYAQFNHLEEAIPAAETLTQVQNLAALLAAGLKPHAQLENDLLITAMEEQLGAGTGPMAVMRMEHDEIEGTLARVQEVRDLAEAQDLVLRAIQLARDHFAKEEQVLFPLAEQALGADTLTQLGARWAEGRRVTVAI
jgi:hybrid cluster-associated redox disulfide protein